MTEYILLSLGILALVSVTFVLVVLRERDQTRFAGERAAWVVERRELNNRLMSRNWPEYVALKREETRAETPEPPVEKTNDYDKAWAL